jgi:hypothetical protein
MQTRCCGGSPNHFCASVRVSAAQAERKLRKVIADAVAAGDEIIHRRLFDALGSLASHCAAAFVDHSSWLSPPAFDDAFTAERVLGNHRESRKKKSAGRGCLCAGCARHEARHGAFETLPRLLPLSFFRKLPIRKSGLSH